MRSVELPRSGEWNYQASEVLTSFESRLVLNEGRVRWNDRVLLDLVRGLYTTGPSIPPPGRSLVVQPSLLSSLGLLQYPLAVAVLSGLHLLNDCHVGIIRRLTGAVDPAKPEWGRAIRLPLHCLLQPDHPTLEKPYAFTKNRFNFQES